MTNLFAAAIECLRNEDLEFCGDDNQPAIRVLEAAGRVDKEWTLFWLDKEHLTMPGYRVDAFLALLAALPDATPSKGD